MHNEKEQTKLSPQEESIIKTLLYYDIFDHPLTHDELLSSCDFSGSAYEFSKSIEKLSKNGLIQLKDDFYYMKGKSRIIEERVQERARVHKYLKIAGTMTRIIASFPFVRGVLISGSLSKYRLNKNGDIDYLIITEPERLWISRTLLTLFKKIFLLNSYKLFCLNYFVDTESLEFEGRDAYTATEVITLIPTYNYALYEELLKANQWALNQYPNFKKKDAAHIIRDRKMRGKKWIERMLLNKTGQKLDEALMHMTLKYRKRKFKHLNKEKFQNAFKTMRNISTHHPSDFKTHVMKKLKQQIQEFETNHDIEMHTERYN